MRNILRITMRSVLGAIVVASLFYIVGCMYIYTQPPTIWRPEEGIWFCEELQMQMDFNKGGNTYAIVEGQKITCTVSNDRGSTHVRIICQEPSHDTYTLDHVFFAGIYLDLTDSQFVLKEVKTKNIYVFHRMD